MSEKEIVKVYVRVQQLGLLLFHMGEGKPLTARHIPKVVLVLPQVFYMQASHPNNSPIY